jgi:hypothetical protein
MMDRVKGGREEQIRSKKGVAIELQEMNVGRERRRQYLNHKRKRGRK